MKKGVYIYIWAILLSWTTMSCEHDFDIDVPRATKNVVLSNFSPDNALKVYVSSTVPVGEVDTELLKYPTDAKVALTEDGVLIGNLTLVEDIINERPYYRSDLKVQAGLLYEIEVSVNGKPISTARNLVPKDLADVNVQLISLVEKADPNYPEMVTVTARVRVEIEDYSTKGFYYHVNGSAYGEWLTDLKVVNNVDHLRILHEDGILVRLPDEDSSPKFINLELKFPYYPNSETREPFQIEIRNCSEDYYLFHRSVGEQEVSNFRDGFLSTQSVQIHNNINNGVGNFSSFNSREFDVNW